MTSVVLVVAVTALLVTWITWTAARVDRLHFRIDAARASLDAHLVRRAAAAHALADWAVCRTDEDFSQRLHAAARLALDADESTREAAENDLGRVLQELPAGLNTDLLKDLHDAASRVVLARRFYNDAVRDTRALRRRWMPRLFRLAGRRPLPTFFEIDDTTPSVSR